jgi:cysteine-rich repeat protein
MGECGNGVVEAFGAEPEECDDGNLDPQDGCDETCALDRRVFVSSTLHQGGNGGGLTGLTGLKLGGRDLREPRGRPGLAGGVSVIGRG